MRTIDRSLDAKGCQVDVNEIVTRVGVLETTCERLSHIARDEFGPALGQDYVSPIPPVFSYWVPNNSSWFVSSAIQSADHRSMR